MDKLCSDKTKICLDIGLEIELEIHIHCTVRAWIMPTLCPFFTVSWVGLQFVIWHFLAILFRSSHLMMTCRPMGGSRGGQGVRTPTLKNHKNIGFLSNTGPDPLKNHKATKPTFIVGPSSARQRNATRKWRFAGGPMMSFL